ncbi:hemerythrin domain-containing protein [Cohnella terricola]|uniref:Hemerythrin domain-containing protein n=1 Tax=Cohnella terricola TaxID=1289167 RepID=A0A559JQ19_9BACL|nr:hemerythrin domain-containing protein [Cohnella terricola]TVY01971.1 hemerythrin domain-containing protein [Cohnella terricola]
MKSHVPIDSVISGGDLRELIIDSTVARAKQEHELLSEELREIYEQACTIRRGQDAKRLNREIRQLGDSVKHFLKHWTAHTQWEDDELFPSAASVLGAEPDLFSLMEHEYELAEQYIQAFTQLLEKAAAPIDQEEARKMTTYLIQAYAVLSNRFREEEEIMLELTDRSNAYGF